MDIYQNLLIKPDDMFSMMTWTLLGITVYYIFDLWRGDKY